MVDTPNTPDRLGQPNLGPPQLPPPVAHAPFSRVEAPPAPPADKQPEFTRPADQAYSNVGGYVTHPVTAEVEPPPTASVMWGDGNNSTPAHPNFGEPGQIRPDDGPAAPADADAAPKGASTGDLQPPPPEEPPVPGDAAGAPDDPNSVTIRFTEGFTDVSLRYPEGTTAEDMYDPARVERLGKYLGSIVVVDQLEETIAPDFVHVDGSIQFDDEGNFSLENLTTPTAAEMPEGGKREFIDGFRNIVNARTEAAGGIEAVMIPEDDYAAVEQQVDDFLAERGTAIRGELVAAAAVKFPYQLRQEGGVPLDVPPPFAHLIREGEEILNEPLAPTGDPAQDSLDINVIQAVYADPATGEITGRVGLVWDDDRVPAFAAMRQVLARRGQLEQPPAETPAQIAARLTGRVR